jgi:hypothetical protein
MGTKQAQEKQLRSDLKRKQQELDELVLRSETLPPSAYGAQQGQLEGEGLATRGVHV